MLVLGSVIGGLDSWDPLMKGIDTYIGIPRLPNHQLTTSWLKVLYAKKLELNLELFFLFTSSLPL